MFFLSHSVFLFIRNAMEFKRTPQIFIILCPSKIKVNQLYPTSLSYLHLKKKRIRGSRVTFTISLSVPSFILLIQLHTCLYITPSGSANRNTYVYQKAQIKAADIDSDRVLSVTNPLGS